MAKRWEKAAILFGGGGQFDDEDLKTRPGKQYLI